MDHARNRDLPRFRPLTDPGRSLRAPFGPAGHPPVLPVRGTLAGNGDKRSIHERRTVADLLYVAIMIAVFAVLFLLLKGVERIER